MYALINLVSIWAIPIIIVFIPLFAFTKKVPVYESFIDGAKDGFSTAIQIIPHLVGMMVAISIFRASGALDFFVGWTGSFLTSLGVPSEILPLGLLRPLTGTGSLAFATDLIREYGPDSMIGRMASTIQGSTDTTLYVLTVYMGAVGIRNGRYALKVGLFSDAVGFVAAIAVCLIFFG
ncbi:spore maturation protein [Paenibacillus macquariensis]|uniref:Spore maturation protein B n=1 Tax=Paenibacillus macquariensis TaxID=948756 RepID=A0ABY1JJW0_9BACL|nr:nucleoside recognition domain-containing protein [Paenibacillus macquariensis]MEC0089808.1 spore maturation protein [Paenibacillus macquariensis]OAB30723.1 spore maturation protein [Paenibacillus macquariensis subsp. macquariensis]SIQ31633.1 spore maturation protein B [Paenibacillus macquariensis]